MHKYETQRPFYLQRDGKAMTITPEKLLRAYQKNQLREGDLIRQSGEREWRKCESIDWNSIAELGKSAAAASKISSANPVEGTVENGHQVAAWWSEAPAEQIRSQRGSTSRIVRRIVLGVGCLAMLGIIYFFSNRAPTLALSSPSSSMQAIANSEGSEPNSVSAIESEPSPQYAEDPRRPISKKSIPTLESIENVPPSQVIQDSFETTIGATESRKQPENADSLSKSLVTSNESSSESINASEAVESNIDDSDNKTGKDSKGLINQFDKVDLDSTAYKSKSAEIDSKSDLDNLFDLTAALLDFYVATTKDLRENQARFNDFKQSIVGLETYFTETDAMVENARSARDSLYTLASQIEGELRGFGVAGREQLVDKQRAALAEMALLDAKLNAAQRTYPIKQRELVQKREGLQGVTNKLIELSAREGESITRLVADLDLYYDKPKAYHERLKTLSDNVINSNPDVLVAYLLSGCSALAVSNTETAEKAIKDLRKQFELVPQIQRELRKGWLIRYQSVGDLIDAMRCEQLDDRDGTVKWLQLVKNRDALFADVWLVHGLHASKRERIQDARSMFERAIRLGSNDPRIHRVALRSLLGQKEVPVPIIKAMTQGLEAKAGATDWNSWYVISTAYAQLGDTSSALAAFERITENSWNKTEIEALKNKIESLRQ